MTKENKPEDLETTVRLDMTKISDPYDTPSSTTVDNIEDIFSSKELSSEPTASYELPEEAIISVEEGIDFDDLTKEINALSNEFDHDIQQKKPPQAPVVKDQPIEEAKKVEKVIKKAAIPTPTPTPPLKDEQAAPAKAVTPPTDKKQPKAKEASLPTSKKPQPAPSTTNKSSNGISIAMLGISLIALITALTGIWTSMSSQSQIDSLSAQLNTIQNNPQGGQGNNQQSELIAVQKQLISLKQTVDSLKVTPEIAPVINSAPADIAKPVTKVSPAVITPATPVKEVKPTFQKNTWNVIISSHDSMKKANKEQQRKAIKAMQTSIVPVVVKGNTWYRIVASGFADKQQAISFAHKLKKLGISDAWIQYNK